MPYVAFGIVTVVVTLGMAIFLLRWLKRLAKNNAQAVRDRYAGRTLHILVENVNFFGQQSLGVTQGRGNGTLAVAEDEIYFLRWLPQKEFVVPLRDIESVEIVKSFLGKTRFTPLLKITFRSASGTSDAMAWHVGDAYNLKEQLEERISAQR